MVVKKTTSKKKIDSPEESKSSPKLEKPKVKAKAAPAAAAPAEKETKPKKTTSSFGHQERTFGLMAPIVAPPKVVAKKVVAPPPAAVVPPVVAPEVKETAVKHKKEEKSAVNPEQKEAPKPAPVVEKPKQQVPVQIISPTEIPAKDPKKSHQHVSIPTTPPVSRPVQKKVEPRVEEKPKAAPVPPKFKEKKKDDFVSSTSQNASESAQQPQVRKKIKFHEMMTVKDLSEAMGVKVADVIKKLLTLGMPASINQRISSDNAALLAEAFECDIEVKSLYTEEESDIVENPNDLLSRPPVVTVMGHVDHGKTSLLDAIRSANVAKGEAGGITQHIGAYQVKAGNGVVTFLDTPGHAAFTAMRARGANVTDLVVLVVAADDSVMPQTVEAIDHAKAAGVSIVVAINKVDLPTANVQKVKQELAQHNLLAEDWGGKTVMVEVSAKTRKNIDKLLEMILLETELLELKSNPNRPARGSVLEARMDPRRGITATVLIQSGTLRVGDVIVCGLTFGKVKAMLDENWKPLREAGPSTPVAILGLSSVPQVGDQISVVESERAAREIIDRRKLSVQESKEKKAQHLSLESLHDQITEGKLQELKIILKADVQGSLQAIQDSLGKISSAAIQIRFVHVGVGHISESDVLLAEASDAILFGFHVKIESSAEAEAKLAGVDVRTYDIIYEMLADIEAAMEGLLAPVEKEVVKGKAMVKNSFPSSKFGQIAGVIVQEGKITRGFKARLIRAGQVIGTGAISSLKRFKDDVKEVEKGFECGLAIEGVRSYLPNDNIEVFQIEKHAQRLTAS